MSIVFSWILVVVSYSGGATSVAFSPPFIEEETCERVKATVLKINPYAHAECVKVGQI